MDSKTRKQKQQELITALLERKIRRHAQHLYDERGRADGTALEDWVEAESQVLENNILAPLYRKSRTREDASADLTSGEQSAAEDQAAEAGS